LGVLLKRFGRQVTPLQQQPATVGQGDAQRPRPRGRPWPRGTSGNPQGARVNTRAKTLFAELSADFGGAEALPALDRVLLMQGCKLLARAERVKDADSAVRLTSEARRILASLRKRAAPPSPSGPSLAEYLASIGNAEPQEAPDDEPNEEAPAEKARTSEPLNGAAEASSA
jgi:hypothetical protein